VKNAVTFDVEDYFHVAAFADHVNRSQWDSFPSRVEANTNKILEMLAQTQSLGTFFVLGWIAQKFPALVRSIAAAGHEVACHSLHHRRVFDMTPNEFREDTRQAKQMIEDVCGLRVLGYRAPSFSVTRDSLWALEILAKLGFEYDSSIFPVEHPSYGMPESPRFPFSILTDSGPLVEFPMTTVHFGGKRSPLSGGAYMRILPYRYMRWGFRYLNECENQAFCFYLHPWELDSDQPRIEASLTARLRHYIGLRGAQSKLSRLLHDFDFEQMIAIVGRLKDSLPELSVDRLMEPRPA
jgi:polysaccharide deacetylase family protein (PEP-CTERM system associated)